jgi:hypothetical protein
MEDELPRFIIGYDLRNQRNYQPLYNRLTKWNAARLLDSLWLAELAGSAEAVRDILRNVADADDGVVVIELVGAFDWATFKAQLTGVAWLKAKSP